MPRPAWPLGCAQPTICYFLCVRKCRRADSRPIAHRCTRIYAPVALENHLADKEPRRTCTSPVSESSEIPFIPTMKAIFVGAPRPIEASFPSVLPTASRLVRLLAFLLKVRCARERCGRVCACSRAQDPSSTCRRSARCAASSAISIFGSRDRPRRSDRPNSGRGPRVRPRAADRSAPAHSDDAMPFHIY